MTHSLCLATMALAALACRAHVAVAQTPSDGDLDEGRRLLGDVRDHEFGFDDEAFYWFCEKARTDANASRYEAAEDEAPVVWRHLLERPADFRGRVVLVRGRLMRHERYTVAGREHLGTLHQCELVDPDTRAICTVVLTEDPGEIRHRSMVACKGFFIKVRSFATDSGDTGTGPLVVGRRLKVVALPPAGAEVGTFGAMGAKWVVGATVALGLLWVFLRRHAAGRPVSDELPRGQAASTPPSQADFDWIDTINEPEPHERRGGD